MKFYNCLIKSFQSRHKIINKSWFFRKVFFKFQYIWWNVINYPMGKSSDWSIRVIYYDCITFCIFNLRVFQNFCELTFPCHSEDEVRRISFLIFWLEKKNMRFFAGCRMTMWIFGTVSFQPYSKICVERYQAHCTCIG
jgi:hypothetical protein